MPSSSIQTILSVPESHRVVPYGSRTEAFAITAGRELHPALKMPGVYHIQKHLTSPFETIIL